MTSRQIAIRNAMLIGEGGVSRISSAGARNFWSSRSRRNGTTFARSCRLASPPRARQLCAARARAAAASATMASRIVSAWAAQPLSCVRRVELTGGRGEVSSDGAGCAGGFVVPGTIRNARVRPAPGSKGLPVAGVFMPVPPPWRFAGPRAVHRARWVSSPVRCGGPVRRSGHRPCRGCVGSRVRPRVDGR